MSYITHGYRRVYVGHDHPMADRNGECYEHRLVASKTEGRTLLRREHVHHIDGNKLNNSPENLRVCGSHAEHFALHHRVSDAELRSLILDGLRYKDIERRGASTYRIRKMRLRLEAEGFDLSYRTCPNGHPYPDGPRPEGIRFLRCLICYEAARVRRRVADKHRAQSRRQFGHVFNSPGPHPVEGSADRGQEVQFR